MKIKKIIATLMTAGVMLTFLPTTAMAATKGWNGNDKDGWRYYTSSSSYVKNNWKQINGKWYYFNSKGYMESNCYRDGCWLTKSGAWDKKFSKGTWKKDSTGWWYTDNGWYPKNQWLWIDGSCYYFNSKGYMESNCYRDGCWLTSSGAWDTRYSYGTWKQDSKGWWYTDNGWYPKNQWLWIDGTKCWFDSNGYWNPSGQPREMKSYIGKKASIILEEFGDFKRAEPQASGWVNDEFLITPYSNNDETIEYFRVKNTKDYSLYGINLGMNYEEAIALLEKNGATILQTSRYGSRGNIFICWLEMKDGNVFEIVYSSDGPISNVAVVSKRIKGQYLKFIYK